MPYSEENQCESSECTQYASAQQYTQSQEALVRWQGEARKGFTQVVLNRVQENFIIAGGLSKSGRALSFRRNIKYKIKKDHGMFKN